jgi:hypothetical protein
MLGFRHRHEIAQPRILAMTDQAQVAERVDQNEPEAERPFNSENVIREQEQDLPCRGRARTILVVQRAAGSDSHVAH